MGWGGGGGVVFFFNDTATTEIYTLSLHDALPIWSFSILVAKISFKSFILKYGIFLYCILYSIITYYCIFIIIIFISDYYDASTSWSDASLRALEWLIPDQVLLVADNFDNSLKVVNLAKNLVSTVCEGE